MDNYNRITYFKARQWAFLYIKQYQLDPSVANYLLLNLLGWDNTHLLMHYRDLMPKEQLDNYQSSIKEYVKGVPPQYIIGRTSFYGIDLKVNPNVLIPRPETEELVEWILSDYPQEKLDILDVGTGSGAIAIALKKNRPNWNVYASDISDKALDTARENAKSNQVSIKFIQSDLFNNLKSMQFNVVVSNPPYVANNEVKYMDESVLKYEPKLALFAANDGLQIYQRISQENRGMIKNKGSLYLEIGFRQKESVQKIFKKYNPNQHVIIKNDIEGHPRMMKALY